MKAMIGLLAMLCCSEGWTRHCELQFNGPLAVVVRYGGFTVLADAEGAQAQHAADVALRMPFQDGAPLHAGGKALQVWEAVQLHKGRSSLRLTALPEQAAMLDFSGSTGSCRIYIGGRAMRDEEIGLIPQRFPGADAALPRRAGQRIFGVVTRTGALRLAVPVPGQVYRIRPVRR